MSYVGVTFNPTSKGMGLNAALYPNYGPPYNDLNGTDTIIMLPQASGTIRSPSIQVSLVAVAPTSVYCFARLCPLTRRLSTAFERRLSC